MDLSGIKFKSSQLKKLITQLQETAYRKAEESNQTRAFHNILLLLSEIFPEDSPAIFELLGVATVKRSVPKVVMKGSQVFAGKGKRPLKNPDCPTCPDNLEDPSRKPGINVKAKGSDLISQMAEEGLYDGDPPPKQITELSEVESLEDLKQFLQIESRDEGEVIDQIKSLGAALGVKFHHATKSLDTFLQQLYDQGIKSPAE